MSDLNSLMIFAKVVEANSFSKAARTRRPIKTKRETLGAGRGGIGILNGIAEIHDPK